MKVSKILSSEYATFRNEIENYFKSKILFNKPSLILDPMAGTAPLIPFVETCGHKAYFNDILPVHYYINSAKTYEIFQTYLKFGSQWFYRHLLNCLPSLRNKYQCISDGWFDEEILIGLTNAWRKVDKYEKSIATFLRATILLCVRPLSSILKTKNPTWFKPGGMSSNKKIQEIIGESLVTFDKYYQISYGSSDTKGRGKCIFINEDAAKLELSEKADFILTSPPYCNRLDYVIQYGPENYFLSAVGHPIPGNNLIGTTRVRDYETLEADIENITNKSDYASELLSNIKKTQKVDDKIYYLKYFTRYFTMLSHTVENILKNLSSSGRMYIVLQDNSHRGKIIEIDKVLRQLLEKSGWQSRVVKKWERHHLGLRNISREHAFIKPKQFEKLMVIWR